MLVFHSQLLRRVPVDHLSKRSRKRGRGDVQRPALWKGSRMECFRTHLQVRHVFVALLGAGVVGQLHVPKARELMNQEWVLFDHSIEDVLHTHTHTQSAILDISFFLKSQRDKLYKNFKHFEYMFLNSCNIKVSEIEVNSPALGF